MSTQRMMDAFDFAKVKHKGQLDDSGENYYSSHLFPVMEAVNVFTKDEDMLIASLLHDTLEDTDTSYDELEIHFGKRVADLVLEVTHKGKKDGYGFYFPNLKTADGILIKLCDRASNISRMKPWSPKRRQHYIKKTKFWKDGSDRFDSQSHR